MVEGEVAVESEGGCLATARVCMHGGDRQRTGRVTKGVLR